jgi:phosphoesterase RecJ-like protein
MHQRPDGDTVGTCSALLKLFRILGIDAEYACADRIPDRLAFLLEGERASQSPSDREIIAVDVASPSQLGALSPLSESVSLTIDHHAVNLPFSDNLTLPDASSAGEVLYSVIDELIKMGKAELSADLSYPLYASISSDTGGFIFSSATPATYRLAANLMETGIDFSDINRRLFHSKSRKQLNAEGLVASKLQTAMNGKIAYATVSRAERLAADALPEHFETAIDIVRSAELAEIAIFVRENDDGSIKASLRSTGFNVAEIAAQFGGGGHVRAAGCTLKAANADEAVKTLITTIEKVTLK